MARVTLAQSAQTDLLEAWLYIAEENQQAADRVLDTIDKEANTLLLQPLFMAARAPPAMVLPALWAMPVAVFMVP